MNEYSELNFIGPIEFLAIKNLGMDTKIIFQADF